VLLQLHAVEHADDSLPLVFHRSGFGLPPRQASPESQRSDGRLAVRRWNSSRRAPSPGQVGARTGPLSWLTECGFFRRRSAGA
jgi:hypothetical protein